MSIFHLIYHAIFVHCCCIQKRPNHSYCNNFFFEMTGSLGTHDTSGGNSDRKIGDDADQPAAAQLLKQTNR
jgi:hypothetical protein